MKKKTNLQWLSDGKGKKNKIARNKHGRNLIPLVSAWRRRKKGRGRMTLNLKKCGWRMEKGWTRFLGRKECGCLVWREEWLGNARYNFFSSFISTILLFYRFRCLCFTKEYKIKSIIFYVVSWLRYNTNYFIFFDY